MHTCMNCIIKVVSRVPNWDKVDDAINDDCRDVCVEGASFRDAWAYFYTDFHNALRFEEEPCPPKFPPPPVVRADTEKSSGNPENSWQVRAFHRWWRAPACPS